MRSPIIPLLAAVALCFGCATRAPDPEAVILPYVSSFSANAEGEKLPDGWKPWGVTRFKRATDYRLVKDDGRTVVRASASSSASGLIHPLDLDSAEYRLLQWRWKVDQLIANADNTQKQTEDSPVRLIVSFAGDMDALDFGDRMFFDQIKAFTGEQLPYATLMYIWENRAPLGTVIPNRHTSRIKMIVAESGRDKLGEWREETRDVYADFERAFGEKPGRIIAVGIMTDTDNTGENTHAYYGDIAFKRGAD